MLYILICVCFSYKNRACHFNSLHTLIAPIFLINSKKQTTSPIEDGSIIEIEEDFNDDYEKNHNPSLCTLFQNI